MALLNTRTLILKTYRYSDTSKILRLLTLERGPCSAMARGALRPKSRFGGMLEPFIEGDATLYVREGRELHTLSAFELVRERRGLGRDLGTFTAASVMCELVMRLAPEHPDDRLFQTMRVGLDALLAANGGSYAAVGLRHVWAVVETLGFRPDLEACAACGRGIGEEPVCFDLAAGGLRCRRCPPSGPSVTAGELASLRRLVGGHDAEPPVGPQGRWLADFIRYHLAEGSNLRSLPFLQELA